MAKRKDPYFRVNLGVDMIDELTELVARFQVYGYRGKVRSMHIAEFVRSAIIEKMKEVEVIEDVEFHGVSLVTEDDAE